MLVDLTDKICLKWYKKYEIQYLFILYWREIWVFFYNIKKMISSLSNFSEQLKKNYNRWIGFVRVVCFDVGKNIIKQLIMATIFANLNTIF